MPYIHCLYIALLSWPRLWFLPLVVPTAPLIFTHATSQNPLRVNSLLSQWISTNHFYQSSSSRAPQPHKGVCSLSRFAMTHVGMTVCYTSPPSEDILWSTCSWPTGGQKKVTDNRLVTTRLALAMITGCIMYETVENKCSWSWEHFQRCLWSMQRKRGVSVGLINTWLFPGC